ncbi:hypothetical protein DV495_004476 [Geotrichum candidum]|uniref:Fatty acid desaturase domain-containing protein n=1 Tax=Geotrichum candidum TaxID=1173061 RepID=A0A0J9X4D4_GEOCN|nr:hypothetical protein DV452_004970 [Geotrichum candidum]KAI9210016.1 hypothetical protein DS838_005104 [Geotrichum bryndzae]KAF5109063.1 hypothetical protein DV454_005057 [Geotrichum candidum]KAF5120670.1 hypothetical protein DV495_004476 [Geotrichum candidum]KAF7499734.1 hypothetical protein DV113_002238 [Geotrichum candidum]
MSESVTNTLTQRRPEANLNGFGAYDQLDQNKGSVKTTVNTYGETFVVPQFTIKEILDAIPAECYKRSYVKSFSYVARDLFFIGLFAYAAHAYLHLIPWVSLRVVAWIAYGFVQGLFGTGCWVLAHECGHGAFSDSKTVNDIVGWILHSALLVPYHSWRISHGKHHKATGNLQRDMVFVPKTKEEFFSVRNITEAAEDTPILTLWNVLLQQLFGWIMYLFTNVTGQKYPNRNKWAANHFLPSSPIFDKKDFMDIVISDIGILTTMTLIYLSIQKWGFSTVALYYIIPYLWVNHWLVFITYLQHSDPTLPHYDITEWNFARGAAATIDRDFGFIGKHIFHDIIETHVLHHFVSRIPFYNGRQGTEAIKKVLGEHYRRDDSNMVKALYKVARACQFVEGDNGVKMFRNFNNIGVAPKKGNRLSE